MRMNEFEGKEILATVRSEDFAHAGEEEAIELVFKNISKQGNRKILDAGCGRGGSADYVRRHGWGNVLGIDVEGKSIEYAKGKYPSVQFHTCDICDVGESFPGSFDLIYLLNAFYAVEDKSKGMKSLRSAAKKGASLCLFDYVTYDEDAPPLEGILCQKPATAQEFGFMLEDANWELEANTNLDEEYIRWYRNLLTRIDNPALKNDYSKETIDLVREKYATLLAALEEGTIGGLLFFARAK
jgi:SAM-dependent methyltransferase